MTDGNPFDFTAAGWRSASCLRAKMHGAVSRHRPPLACPERGLATFEALRRCPTETLAADGVRETAAVTRGLLLQPLDQAAIPE
jgi:hypothetical protein